MPTADDLRAQLHVAELEERLVAAKDAGADTSDIKAELRYARWVQRGGPDSNPADDTRADKAHRERYGQEG